jgi:hypothetical protein
VTVERVFPGATSSAAIGRGLVASSFQYYLTGDEALRVTVHTLSGAGATEIAMRIWREADRQILMHRETLRTVDPGPSTVTHDYPLPPGALLNLRIARGSGLIFYGITWVQAQLIRGSGGAVEVIGTLVQGYIGTGQDLGWPGSPIEKQDQASGFIVTAIPSIAGFTASWVCPVGERWRVISGSILVQMSGIVGNRYPTLVVNDGAAQAVYRDASELAIGAGNAIFYGFAGGVTRSATAGSTIYSLCLPENLELNAGQSITFVIVNGLAGDTVSGGVLAVRTRVDG